jgi:outer membrane lipoprotein-sorting protein
MVSRIIIKAHLLIIALVFFSVTLIADRVDDTYQKMINAYAKVTSWQAVINQSNYFTQAKTSLNSSGTFYYQKGKIAIRYKKPAAQSLLIQNGTITIYDKIGNNAIKSKLVSTVQSLNPVEIVKAYWEKSDKAILQTTELKTVVSIKPKSDEQIKEFKATIDNNTGYITKFSYQDMQGNTVTIAFTRLKINKPIPPSVWNLNIPRSAKVFEN